MTYSLDFAALLKLKAAGLSPTQRAGFNAITAAFNQYGDGVKEHLAYMLATAWHETAATMQPIEEYGKGHGRTYGVTDSTGQVAYGRGYVQLTWPANYAKADAQLGLKGALVHNYALALDPKIAAAILVRGMIEGWFTGKKLSDFSLSDFQHEREIINGLDEAQKIAGYANVINGAIISATTVTTKEVSVSAHTVTQVQAALLAHGYLASQTEVDGFIGPVTTAAVVQFQANNGITADGNLNSKTLDALFNTMPAATPVTPSNAGGILAGLAATFRLPNIGAGVEDYILNFLTSKINGVAILLVATVVGWINTRFGFSVPGDIQNWVTGLLVSGGGLLIMALRTFWNKPVVATAMPKVVTNTTTAGVSNTTPTPVVVTPTPIAVTPVPATPTSPAK